MIDPLLPALHRNKYWVTRHMDICGIMAQTPQKTRLVPRTLGSSETTPPAVDSRRARLGSAYYGQASTQCVADPKPPGSSAPDGKGSTAKGLEEIHDLLARRGVIHRAADLADSSEIGFQNRLRALPA